MNRGRGVAVGAAVGVDVAAAIDRKGVGVADELEDDFGPTST
jgi:hypothetical protein